MVYSDGTLTDEEINYQLSHTNDSKIPSIIATLSILSVLATISVFLRFLVRWHTTAGYKMDDWTILVAFVRHDLILSCTSNPDMNQILSWGSFVAIYFGIVSLSIALPVSCYDLRWQRQNAAWGSIL